MNNVLFERFKEFSEEMAELEKETQKEKQDEACKQLYGLYQSLMNAGFIPSMARDILLVMLKKGLDGESYE